MTRKYFDTIERNNGQYIYRKWFAASMLTELGKDEITHDIYTSIASTQHIPLSSFHNL
jgi:hypothetical protein